MNIKARIELEVIKDGKVIDRRVEDAHSFVQNAAMNIFQVLAPFGSSLPAVQGLKYTDGSDVVPVDWKDIDNPGEYAVDAPAGDDNYGILVGSSDAAFSVDQYNLVSKIPHGTGAGQLEYDQTQLPGAVTSGNTIEYQIKRYFNNRSGGDVTVREIGYAVKVVDAGGVEHYLLLARDVITAITIPDGGTLTVTYRIVVNPS